MLPLLDARQEELDSIFRRLAAIPLQGRFDEVEHVYTALTGPRVEERALLEEHAWDKVGQLSSMIISPLPGLLFECFRRLAFYGCYSVPNHTRY